MPGMNLQLDDYEHRALGLLAVKHGHGSTKSELLRSMIRAAAASDPDVRGWLEAFPETATPARKACDCADVCNMLGHLGFAPHVPVIA